MKKIFGILLLIGASVFTGCSSMSPQSARVPAGVSSKESYQQAFCDKFEMAEDTVDIETLIEDMNASPYASSFNEFWTTPACKAGWLNGIMVPILFNTANNPAKNEDFPSTLHDYLIDEKKDPEVWLKVINTTSTGSNAFTMLDFMEFNIKAEHYSSEKTLSAAKRVVTYLCQQGGVYSKYKGTVKCP